MNTAYKDVTWKTEETKGELSENLDDMIIESTQQQSDNETTAAKVINSTASENANITQQLT